MGSRLYYSEQPIPGVGIRTSTLQDCLELGPNLREEDCQEVAAYAGLDPTNGLIQSFLSSKSCLTVTLEGVPIMMFGTGPSPDNPKIGVVWLLSSPDLLTISKLFLRHSKRLLALLSAPYEVVMNYVDCRNEVHHRWLLWCGFIFITKHEEFGVGKLPFYEFVRI